MDVFYLLVKLHVCLLNDNVQMHNLITLARTSMLSLQKEHFYNLIAPKATARYMAGNKLPFLHTSFVIHWVRIRTLKKSLQCVTKVHCLKQGNCIPGFV
jgi:hypothetical protein